VVWVPSPVTVTWSVWTTALFGPDSVKVIVPVGLAPPDSVAVSVSGAPTTTMGPAVVARVSAAWVMVVISVTAARACSYRCRPGSRR
jgi:hypothetical protein